MMVEVKIKKSDLEVAAQQGTNEFIQVFVEAIHKAIGGELSEKNMHLLNADQITLLAYVALQNEVMIGGFIQLIHNGLGEFIFHNPFDKAVRNWGIRDLYNIISKCQRYYGLYHQQIEQDCTDEEFMALFEQFPEFDTFDDAFIEGETEFTSQIAHYVDDNIENFATID